MSNMSMVELEQQLKELSWMEEKTPEVYKKLDSEFWMIGGLKDLYDMCKDYNQTELPDTATLESVGIIPTTKVIKVNRWIPDEVLRKCKVDSTNFCGLFVAVEGAFVSKDYMDTYFNKKIENNGLLDPVKDLGLSDDYKWTTIRQVHNGIGFVLKYTDFSEEEIPSWNYWEFLTLTTSN